MLVSLAGPQISITATNLTPTSVLLQWNGSEWNGSEGNCYNVSYVLLRTTNPENEENGISLPSIRTICEGVSIVNNLSVFAVLSFSIVSNLF